MNRVASWISRETGSEFEIVMASIHEDVCIRDTHTLHKRLPGNKLTAHTHTYTFTLIFK